MTYTPPVTPPAIPILTEIVDTPAVTKRSTSALPDTGHMSLDALLVPLKETMLQDVQHKALPIIEAKINEHMPKIMDIIVRETMLILKEEISKILDESIKNHTASNEDDPL